MGPKAFVGPDHWDVNIFGVLLFCLPHLLFEEWGGAWMNREDLVHLPSAGDQQPRRDCKGTGLGFRKCELWPGPAGQCWKL